MMRSSHIDPIDVALADRGVLVDVILARDVACDWDRNDLLALAATLIKKRTAFDEDTHGGSIDPCPPCTFSQTEVADVRAGTPGLYVTRVRALRILACAEWAHSTICFGRRAAPGMAGKQRTCASWHHWVGSLFKG
jgi:hypothetical protein